MVKVTSKSDRSYQEQHRAKIRIFYQKRKNVMLMEGSDAHPSLGTGPYNSYESSVQFRSQSLSFQPYRQAYQIRHTVEKYYFPGTVQGRNQPSSSWRSTKLLCPEAILVFCPHCVPLLKRGTSAFLQENEK